MERTAGKVIRRYRVVDETGAELSVVEFASIAIQLGSTATSATPDTVTFFELDNGEAVFRLATNNFVAVLSGRILRIVDAAPVTFSH